MIKNLSYRDQLKALYSRSLKGIKLGLEPMYRACEKVSHPERTFRSVHIAGTNGKGSCCAMIEQIARCAGKKTGLYTSPHLCQFSERIQINGKPLEEKELSFFLGQAMAIGPELSFFETATLACFLAFREHEINFGVIETGLGGKLDATNVLQAPEVTAITSVGLDHMSFLGSTIEDIAREKAGILKPGVPYVLGDMNPSARKTISDVANRVGASELLHSTRNSEWGLHGAYQASNRHVTTAIADHCGFSVEEQKEGMKLCSWPGRYELCRVQKGVLSGLYLLDGAHNPDGVFALLSSLEKERELTLSHLIFGALADKSWTTMLDALCTKFTRPDQRFYTLPKGRKAVSLEDLRDRHEGLGFEHVASALAHAAETRGQGILVCGSLYLVGEARAHLFGLPQDPLIAM